MSAQQQNKSILIVGVLMLGAYLYMRPRAMQSYQQQVGNRPVTMPQSAGAGLAQSAVGAFASFLGSQFAGGGADTLATKYADAVVRSPYLLADHMMPQESVNDILSVDNWSDGIQSFLA